MLQFLRDIRRLRTDRRILELESRIDEKDRLLAVLRAENDALADVVSRDRQRIQAERAAYARRQAESEGNHVQPQPGIR